MPNEIPGATLSITRCAWILALALFGGILNARASDVIATAELSRGGSPVNTNSVQLFVRNGGATNGGTATVFDSFFFTQDQVGQVFSLDQSVDPDFNLFISRLVNGFNDQITIIGRPAGGSSSGLLTSEASFFSTRPPTGNGIDLAGFTIERMDMRINQLSISTSYSIQATLSLIGSPVPEPSGAALIFAGLASAAFARARCRKFRKEGQKEGRFHTFPS